MAAFKFRRGATRSWWINGATMTAVAASILLLAGSASGTLTGGSFQTSGGDLTTLSATIHDWNPAGSPNGQLGPIQAITCATTTPPVNGTNCARDLTGSSSDNALGQGTKEDDSTVSIVTGSIPPQKDDLSRFYINQEVATATGGVIHTGDNLLYLAWERTNTLGSAHMDFELNQSTVGIGTTTTGSVPLNRTAGDVLIDFDFGGSGVPVLQWRKWLTSTVNTTGNASADCEASTTYPCWSKEHDIGAAGEASVNGAPVRDYNAPVPASPGYNTLDGSTVVKQNSTTVNSTFGEAGIDLQAAGIFTTFSCSRFGGAWLKSRSSGSSFVSELKDYIAPLPVNISNCGEIKIIKNTNPRYTNKNFSYSTNVHSGAAANAATFSTTPDSTGTTTGFTLNDRNDVTITNISVGSPTTITTNVANGVIAGNKVTITGSNSTPSLDGTWTVASVVDSKNFTIANNVTAVGNPATGSLVYNTEDITNVPAGSYTVTETMPAGWSLGSLSCVPSDPTGTSFGAQHATGSLQADITVAPDGLVTCTYTNKPNLGAIVITKTGKDNNCASATSTISNGVCTGTGTAKLGGGVFKVTSDSGGTTQVTGSPVTTATATGTVCIDGLSWSGTGTSYYVTETGAPSGYAIDSSTAVQVVVSQNATCNSAKTNVTTAGTSGVVSGTSNPPSLSDTPLTTLEVIATGEAPAGTTKSTVSCTHQVSGSAVTVGTSISTPVDPADWKTLHLAPDTYTCTVVIDP